MADGPRCKRRKQANPRRNNGQSAPPGGRPRDAGAAEGAGPGVGVGAREEEEGAGGGRGSGEGSEK